MHAFKSYFVALVMEKVVLLLESLLRTACGAPICWSKYTTFEMSDIEGRLYNHFEFKWGDVKHSEDLKSGLVGFWIVKRGWFANGLDYEWVLKSGIPIFWNPFCEKAFEILTKYPDFELASFWIDRTRAIVLISNFFRFQMFMLQIPTGLAFLKSK